MLRVVIAVAATLLLAYFFAELPFPFRKMLAIDTRWFDILSGYCMALFAPLLAIAALTLAAMGQRLGVAGILLGVAPLVFWAPAAAVMVGVVIYGF